MAALDSDQSHYSKSVLSRLGGYFSRKPDSKASEAKASEQEGIERILESDSHDLKKKDPVLDDYEARKVDQERYTMPFLRLTSKDVSKAYAHLRHTKVDQEHKVPVKNALDALDKEINSLMERYSRVPVFRDKSFNKAHTFMIKLHERASHRSLQDEAYQYNSTVRDRDSFYKIAFLADGMENRLIKLGKYHFIDLQKIIKPIKSSESGDDLKQQ